MQPERKASARALTETQFRRKIELTNATQVRYLVWLVLEGDWGGQIYLTVPWHLVGENAKIGNLLTRLDKLCWPYNKGDGASAYLIDGVTVGVCGGMGGGGLNEDGLWLHPALLGESEFVGEHAALQQVVDELRGATCEQVKSMQWDAVARELLDMQ